MIRVLLGSTFMLCVASLTVAQTPDGEEGWSDWSEWTQCSAECNGGITQSSRTCTIDTCIGNATQTDVCNTQPCFLASNDEDEYIGCYIDDTVRDMAYQPPELVGSEMTREICIQSCLQAEFFFAALQSGRKCFCGNTFGRYGKADMEGECDASCVGPDGGPVCGGTMRNSIFPTGKELPNMDLVCANGRGVQFSDYCVVFKTDPLPWIEAHQQCVMEGGHLVTPYDKDFQNFLEFNIRFNDYGDYWIGVNDMATEGTFVFTDDNQTPLSVTNFKDGEPNDSTGNSDCVEMKSSIGYQWNDVGCSNYKNYICQYKNESDVPCGQGGVSHNDKCYVFVDKIAKWEDASFDCSMRGGMLASIKDSQTQQFLVKQALKTGSKNSWYIGLNEQNTEGTYEFLDGTVFDEITSYHNFPPGEPDDATSTTDYDCVVFDYATNGLWDDVSCNKAVNYVCELGPLPNTICPYGWTEFDGHCYYYHYKGVDFDTARSLCDHTGHDYFLKIDSPAENDFIYNQFVVGKAVNVWLGLTDRANEGDFKWLDNTDITGITNPWASNEPSPGDTVQNCVIMAKGKDGLWKDLDCATSYIRPVCEMVP